MAERKTSEDKQPVSLSLASAKRIAAVVQSFERGDRGTAAPRGQRAGEPRGQVAKVKTTVGARSGQTAGTGTVTFQVLNDVGAYVDGATDIPVKNPYATELAVGKWVTLVPASGGWTIFGADC